MRSATDSAVVGVGRVEHEQQLLAAEAVRRVVAAERALHGGGERAQRLVAGEMPEPVVVALEAVHVAQRHGAQPGPASERAGRSVASARRLSRPVSGSRRESSARRSLSCASSASRPARSWRAERSRASSPRILDPRSIPRTISIPPHTNRPAARNSFDASPRAGELGVDERDDQQHEDRAGSSPPRRSVSDRGASGAAPSRAATSPPPPMHNSPRTHSGSISVSPTT